MMYSLIFGKHTVRVACHGIKARQPAPSLFSKALQHPYNTHLLRCCFVGAAWVLYGCCSFIFILSHQINRCAKTPQGSPAGRYNVISRMGKCYLFENCHRVKKTVLWTVFSDDRSSCAARTPQYENKSTPASKGADVIPKKICYLFEN